MSKKIYGLPIATPINPNKLIPDVSEDIRKALEEAKASGAFKGDKGDTGAAGYNPVRGTDYWTASDIAEIKSYVDEAILGGAW